jgi:hypothetical protein
MARWSFLVLLGLGLVSGVARAQEEPVVRHGLVFGGALGGGSISAGCDGCDHRASLGLDLHVGGMLSPRLALLFDASGAANYTTQFVQTRYVTSLLYAGAAQYWLLERLLWVKGGLGLARVVQSDAPIFKTFDTATGFGFMAAAGVEVLQHRTFALDAELALRAAFYSGTSVTDGAVLVGVNWY